MSRLDIFCSMKILSNEVERFFSRSILTTSDETSTRMFALPYVYYTRKGLWRVWKFSWKKLQIFFYLKATTYIWFQWAHIRKQTAFSPQLKIEDGRFIQIGSQIFPEGLTRQNGTYLYSYTLHSEGRASENSQSAPSN